jgi:hypothetical protein
MAKLKFSEDQLVSASVASRKLGAIRKRAKKAPQFILENNQVETVLIDFEQYKQLVDRLNTLEEEQLYQKAAQRIEQADKGETKSIPLKDAMTPEEYQKFLHENPDDTSDEELFET